jgi:DNA-binding MarR family transcriptional regulator
MTESSKQIARSVSPAARKSGTGSPAPIDSELAATLRTTIHRLVKLLRRETRDEADLSLTERSTLGSLYQHGELSSSELAQLEKVTNQSMSQIINHLFELKYIHKKPSGEDKRKTILSLTAAGKGNVEERRQQKQEWLAHALREKTTAEEKDLLLKAMTVLAKLIEP